MVHSHPRRLTGIPLFHFPFDSHTGREYSHTTTESPTPPATPLVLRGRAIISPFQPRTLRLAGALDQGLFLIAHFDLHAT